MKKRNDLVEYHKRYERILESMPAGDEQTLALSALMTELEQVYKIPYLRNEAWEAENRKTIALYRKISMSRKF